MRRRRPEVLRVGEPVRLRHIRLGAEGDPGAVEAYGRWWTPQAPKGVNGEHGFLSGSYERAVAQEGKATVTLSSGLGGDGVRHARRFEFFTSELYRPGDEWVEVYVGPPGAEGDPEFVGTPIGGQITATEVTLELADGWFLLKKARETIAGFWCNAPRDVFEAYTRMWQGVLAESFDAEGQQLAYFNDAVARVSPDGRLSYVRATSFNERQPVSDPALPPDKPNYSRRSDALWRQQPEQSRTIQKVVAAPPGALRLRVGGTPDDLSAYVESVAEVADPTVRGWRIEAKWRRSVFTDDARVRFGVRDPADPDWKVYYQDDGEEVLMHADGLSVTYEEPAMFETSPADQNTVVIEARGKWAFFWRNGKLLQVLPIYQVPGKATGVVCVELFSGDHHRRPDQWVDVEYLLARQQVDFLMGRGADPARGDYRLPGAPPSGGLRASYFQEDDGARKASEDRHLYPAAPPHREPAAAREENVVCWHSLLTGSPPGLGLTTNYSGRYTGSIFLQYAQRDYRFRVHCDDRARLFLAKTLPGDHVLEDWTADGHAIAPGTDTVSEMISGVLDGVERKDGWFPLLLEFGQSPGAAGLWLQVARDDAPDGFHTVGAGSFNRELHKALDPTFFAPLDEPWRSSTATVLEQTGGPDGTSEDVAWTLGPVPDQLAADFNGTSSIEFDHDAARQSPGASSATFFAAFKPDASTDGADIVRKPGEWQISQALLDLKVVVRLGGVNRTLTLAGALTNLLGRWLLAAARYDRTTGVLSLRLYDAYLGELLASGTSSPGAGLDFDVDTNDGVRIGGDFDGAIALVAVTKTAVANAVLDELATKVPLRDDALTSPLGIFDQRVRLESHETQAAEIAKTFGHQFTVAPRQLESGQFPGEVAPKVRVGRDTDVVIDELRGASPTVQVKADDVADMLVADGAGLSDQDESSQSALEVVNFGEFEQARHPFLMMEAEQLSDITIPTLLAQRANSLLALRSNVWEEVAVQVPPDRELADRFPLAGEAALFKWEPGDGAFIDLEDSLGVKDLTPRQILSARWPFVPQGLQAPDVGFRQRPRNFRDTLKRIQRESLAQARTYSGQKVAHIGNTARNANAVDAQHPDTYSRVPLTDPSKVVKATVYVTYKANNVDACTIYINDVARVPGVLSPGEYDVTAWAKHYAPGQPRMVAGISSPTAALVHIQLRLIVLV